MGLFNFGCFYLGEGKELAAISNLIPPMHKQAGASQ